MQRKMFRNSSKYQEQKKVTLYGWPTIKGKYFKNLKKKDDLLHGNNIWCKQIDNSIQDCFI